MGDGAAFDDVDAIHFLLRLGKRLLDGVGDFAGFRVGEAIFAMAIADDDERGEAHVLAAGGRLGDAVDLNDALEVFGFLGAAEATTATTAFRRTAFVVAEFAVARTGGGDGSMGLVAATVAAEAGLFAVIRSFGLNVFLGLDFSFFHRCSP